MLARIEIEIERCLAFAPALIATLAGWLLRPRAWIRKESRSMMAEALAAVVTVIVTAASL